MKKYFQVPWNIKDVIIVIACAAILTILALLSLKFSNLKQYFEADNKALILVALGFLIQWIVIFLPLVLLTAKKYKLKLKHFGFEKIKLWTAAKEIIKSYFLYVGISILISIIIINFDVQIPGYQVQESVLPLFGNSLFSLITAALVVVVLAPILEEIFFRGFLLRTLSDKIGIYLGSIVSALIFALLHFPWQSIIPIFILGLIINATVIRTKSIWPAIGFHILNNAIVLVFEILIVKDIISIEKLT